jgi:divinyl chlorophyllide a 8-vinyl-reductase
MVTCVLRDGQSTPHAAQSLHADITQPMPQILGQFDVVITCVSSRSGGRADAWAIDHAAQMNILQVAQRLQAKQFILLSAICVQNPKLPFQFAKLAFEKALMASGLTYSIVRPTAFFKSLSGQIPRLRKGKAFLVFGNGELTACKPISDDDLGNFIVDCITNRAKHNEILPIGGPGPAVTPRDQAQALFGLLGRPVKLRRVPVALLRIISGGLRLASVLSPAAQRKADLAEIGLYYATESMLVWKGPEQGYSEEKTASTGTEHLFDHYAKVMRSGADIPRGDHSVF